MSELYSQGIAAMVNLCILKLLEPRHTDQEKLQLKRCIVEKVYRSQRLSPLPAVYSEKVKPSETDLSQPVSLFPTAVLSTPVSDTLIEKALDPLSINANRNPGLTALPQLSSQQRELIDAIATISRSIDVPMSTPYRQPPSDSRSSSRFDSFHRSIDLAHNTPEISSVEPVHCSSLTAIPVDLANSSALEICATQLAHPSAPTTLPVNQVHLSVSKDYSNTSMKRRNKCKQKWEEFWTSPRSYFMSRHSKLEREAKQGSSSDDDDWVKTVSIIFEDRSGKEILRHAKAKFDTGNPKNLISPAFAAKFGLIFESRNGEVILELPGDGQFVSNGKIAGRWCSKINTSHDRHLSIDPKFMDADFEVSNSPERFDVVIGADTIKSERLLEWGPPLALTGFRNRHEAYPTTAHQDALKKPRIARDEKHKSAHMHSTSGRIKDQQNEMHREEGEISPLLTSEGLDATQQQKGEAKEWRTFREEIRAEAVGNIIYSPYTDATKSTEQETSPFTHPDILNEHANYSDTMENHQRGGPEDAALPISEDLNVDSETKMAFSPSADEGETSDDVSDEISSECSLTPLADSLSVSGAVEDLLFDIPSQPSSDVEIEHPDYASALCLLLQGLMKDGFPEWLHTENHRYCATSPGAKQRSRDQTAINPASSSHGGPSHQSTGRKRSLDSHDHDDQDDEAPKSQKPKLEPPESKPLRVRSLACPFAKHQPLQYLDCCRGTGHDNLSRVKQHLTRDHSMPLYCPFCFKKFKYEGDRDSHIRTSRTNPAECIERPHQFLDRITEQQAIQLQKRMVSTEENWYKVYEILFPGCSRPRSVWHNDHPAEEALMALRDRAAGTVGLNLTRNILQSELHPELHRHFEHILRIIMKILRAFFTNIIEEWEGHITGPTNDNSSEPSGSDNNGNHGQTSNTQPSMPSSTRMAVDPIRLPATLPMITRPSHFISSATANTAQDTSMGSVGADLAQLSVPTISAPLDPTISSARREPSQNFASNVNEISLDPRLRSIQSGTSETNRVVSALLPTQSDWTSDEPVPPFEDPSQMEEYIHDYPSGFNLGHEDDFGSMFSYPQREY